MRDALTATSICLHYVYHKTSGYKWSAELTWVDSKWCEPGSIQGTIETRYTNRGFLREAIDDVLHVAQQFGLSFGEHFGLWVREEREDFAPNSVFPNDWRTLVADEAERRGWKSYERKASNVC